MTAFNEQVAFVHIPKTGGNSCRRYMREHLHGVMMLEEMYAPAPHLALRDFEQWLGRPPSSFEVIFAVVRDPYDHQLSQWLFWKDMYSRGFRMPQHQHAALHADLTHWLCDEQSDWHIHEARPSGGKIRTIAASGKGYLEFGGYYPYWLAVDGEIPDNVRLVRFETLSDDFPAALEEYAGGVFEMPHDNAGPSFKPVAAEYYSPLAIDIVERKFPWAFRFLYDKWKRGDA